MYIAEIFVFPFFLVSWMTGCRPTTELVNYRMVRRATRTDFISPEALVIFFHNWKHISSTRVRIATLCKGLLQSFEEKVSKIENEFTSLKPLVKRVQSADEKLITAPPIVDLFD
jgi:hypothetical protein